MFQYHAGTVANIREASHSVDDYFQSIAIALDTKGPEIRTGVLVSILNKGQENDASFVQLISIFSMTQRRVYRNILHLNSLVLSIYVLVISRLITGGIR